MVHLCYLQELKLRRLTLQHTVQCLKKTDNAGQLIFKSSHVSLAMPKMKEKKCATMIFLVEGRVGYGRRATRMRRKYDHVLAVLCLSKNNFLVHIRKYSYLETELLNRSYVSKRLHRVTNPT